jgi:hypothetical protein
MLPFGKQQEILNFLSTTNQKSGREPPDAVPSKTVCESPQNKGTRFVFHVDICASKLSIEGSTARQPHYRKAAI